ncbi:hypothetical protein BGZ80_009534 [Entomortierella chlamydospora]|uniref:Uncharacterized protein n=1 Tax=Entomortierella chlamydospora TaxID=101097 RepID=A0A9P6MWX4_9FUNG|nr:hypothetical protein BGZ80_009534 [Entomortierella chlamydospora]
MDLEDNEDGERNGDNKEEEVESVDGGYVAEEELGREIFVGEQSILQLLDEPVQQEASFKDQLHFVVERSKSDKTTRIAATNAITILVRARVQFNGIYGISRFQKQTRALGRLTRRS